MFSMEVYNTFAIQHFNVSCLVPEEILLCEKSLSPLSVAFSSNSSQIRKPITVNFLPHIEVRVPSI